MARKSDKEMEISRMENRIRELHLQEGKLETRVTSYRFQIGKLLSHLRDKVIRPGEWRAYMESPATNEHLGFSTSTAWRYVEAFDRAMGMIRPESIEVFEEKGVNLGSPAVLQVIEQLQEESPELETTELVDRVKGVLTMRRGKSRKTHTLKPDERVERICRLLMRLYRGGDRTIGHREVEAAFKQWEAWLESKKTPRATVAA